MYNYNIWNYAVQKLNGKLNHQKTEGIIFYVFNNN